MDPVRALRWLAARAEEGEEEYTTSICRATYHLLDCFGLINTAGNT